MSEQSTKPGEGDDVRQGNWAGPVKKLDASGTPEEAVNLNVDGRKVTSPINGFGQMWQKTYRIRFEGAQPDPKAVIKVWKQEFATFWPKGNYFYKTNGSGGEKGIKPGDVAVLNLAGPGGINAPGGKPVISTGIYVLYADDESFSFLTPQGHMFAAMNTFSAYADEGATYAQIQALVRASDPIYELTFRLGIGHKMEDDFWMATLRNLAKRFQAGGTPTLEKVLVDPQLQWSEAGNVWHNAAVRTGIYLVGAPLRWIGRKMGRKK